MNQIPVVDLSTVIELKQNIDAEVDSINLSSVAKEIGNALHNVGFVYLVNHGLDPHKLSIEDAFQESKKFFEQPIDKKVEYKKNNATKGYHGGYSLGVRNSSDNNSVSPKNDDRVNGDNEKKNGQSSVYEFDFRESFDFTGSRGYFPEKDNPRFHTSLLNLEEECKPLVKLLFKILGMALELEDADFFVDSTKWIENSKIPSFKTFRSLYYPAIPDEVEIPPGKDRVKEHSDFSFMTLLFQDSIGGLEIKTLNGNWIEATPIEGSILINIGDMLDVWTGGYFHATKHRVLIPAAEIKKRTPRQSIVYFVHPDSSTLMAPLKSKLLPDYHFETIAAYEFTKMKLADVNSY